MSDWRAGMSRATRETSRGDAEIRSFKDYFVFFVFFVIKNSLADFVRDSERFSVKTMGYQRVIG